MNNIEKCTCPKQIVGQGFRNGQRSEGVLAEPANHLDTCPKFVDYSTASELHEMSRTEAETNLY